MLPPIAALIERFVCLSTFDFIQTVIESILIELSHRPHSRGWISSQTIYNTHFRRLVGPARPNTNSLFNTRWGPHAQWPIVDWFNLQAATIRLALSLANLKRTRAGFRPSGLSSAKGAPVGSSFCCKISNYRNTVWKHPNGCMTKNNQRQRRGAVAAASRSCHGSKKKSLSSSRLGRPERTIKSLHAFLRCWIVIIKLAGVLRRSVTYCCHALASSRISSGAVKPSYR